MVHRSITQFIEQYTQDPAESPQAKKPAILRKKSKKRPRLSISWRPARQLISSPVLTRHIKRRQPPPPARPQQEPGAGTRGPATVNTSPRGPRRDRRQCGKPALTSCPTETSSESHTLTTQRSRKAYSISTTSKRMKLDGKLNS